MRKTTLVAIVQLSVTTACVTPNDPAGQGGADATVGGAGGLDSGQAGGSGGDGGDGGAGACSAPQPLPEFPLATCGNGIVDPFEECDAGGEESAICDLDCTTAHCGDGYLNEAAGECCEFDLEIAPCSPANFGCYCCEPVSDFGIAVRGLHDPDALNAPDGPGFSSSWTYDGQVGSAAGSAMCEAAGLGWLCAYRDLNYAITTDQLHATDLSEGTYWLHRTIAHWNGLRPTPGVRCDDWTGASDADGEYVTITHAGASAEVTLHRDGNPFACGDRLDGQAGPCEDVTRGILCCDRLSESGCD